MVHVTMVLAHGPGAPEGDVDDRIYLEAALTAQGQLDSAAWATGTAPWRSRRERAGQEIRAGELVKLEDGWALRQLDSEDEPLYSVNADIIRPGEIVSVRRLDGDEMLYRVVAVDPD